MRPVGDPFFELVRHGATADVIVIGHDRRFTPELKRPARRMVPVDDADHRVVRIEPGKSLGIPPLDSPLHLRNRDALRFSLHDLSL